MATRTISATGGTRNWDLLLTWVELAVPTSADLVVATAGSGALRLNVAGACRSFDMTGYTNTLTHGTGINLAIGDGTAGAGSVAFRLVAGMTYTRNNTATSSLSFVSTSGTQQTVTFGGQRMANMTFNGAGGSWLLVDALTARNGTIIVTAGSLDTGGVAVDVLVWLQSGSTTRSVNLRTSLVIVEKTSGTPWSSGTTTNLTFRGLQATISFNVASSSSRTFAGGWLSYGALTLTTAGSTGALIVTGQNTFGAVNFSDASNARTLTLPSLLTQSVTTLNINGTASRLMTVASSSAGRAATLAMTRGATMTYASVQDIAATPSGVVYALDSTDVSGNSGIVFSPPDNLPFREGPVRFPVRAQQRAASW